MPDREKVIKGLEICKERNYCCQECPYYDRDAVMGCHSNELMEDALALLKEQEAMIVRCKDCVSFCYNNPYIGTSASNAIRCPCNSINPDWFCADGVKKDA